MVLKSGPAIESPEAGEVKFQFLAQLGTLDNPVDTFFPCPTNSSEPE